MAAPAFGVTLDDEARSLVLRGEFDLAAVPEFEAALELFLATDRDPVVLEMRHVTFADSAALSALLRAHRACEESGRKLELRAPSDPVRRLLDLTALALTFTIVD